MPSMPLPFQNQFADSTTKKPAKRRVTFRPSVTVQPVENICMQEQDKSRLYYSKDELKVLTLEAKAIHALSKEQLPDESSPCGVHAARQDCMLGLEADPALRGLELYLCPTRVRNKQLAKKALLKYYRTISSDPTKSQEERLKCLSNASQKLMSQWSKKVALETARLDSIRAYDGDYLIPVDTPAVEICPFPVILKKRRVTQDDEEEEMQQQAAKRRRSW